MKKFTLLTTLGVLAMAVGMTSNNVSTKAESYNYDVDVSKFSIVAGSGALTADTEAKSIAYRGGWASAFAVTDELDTTATEYTFSSFVQMDGAANNGEQLGYVIYFDSSNYFQIYCKFNGCGTVSELVLRALVDGAWSNAYASAIYGWGTSEYTTQGEFCSCYSDFGGWVTDSPDATGSESTGNWNHFRSESQISLSAGFTFGINVKKINYLDRDSWYLQMFFTDTGKDTKTHTWYTKPYCVDAFTNPLGGSDSAYKNVNAKIGVWNCDLPTNATISHSNFKFTSNKAPTGPAKPIDVTCSSLRGIPANKVIDEENNKLSFEGGWGSQTIALDGISATGTYNLTMDVKKEGQENAGDAGVGFLIYYNEQNYIFIYMHYNGSCSTFAEYVSRVRLNGVESGGGFNAGRDPWDNLGTTGEWVASWSDFGGFATDSEVPYGGENDGNWNHFRTETANKLWLNTGFEIGLGHSRKTYKSELVDAYYVSMKAEGVDGNVHTWYSPVWCYDAFTNPLGGAASALKDVTPTIGLVNFGFGGAVEYSNLAFNGTTLNVKKPTSYTVSFSDDVASQTIENGYTATAPTEPTKAGYKFDGWMNGEQKYDFNTAVTGDVSLTASWVKVHDVQIDIDGTIEHQSVVNNEKATKPATNPTKAGWTFKEWQVDGVAYDWETPVTGDMTIKAVFEEIPATIYTISFKGIEKEAIKVEEGNKVTKPEDPVKEGYDFDGWFVGETEFDWEQAITKDVEVEAKFTQLFTVSFSDDVTSQTIRSGEKATAPEAPAKLWHTFEGWKLGDEFFDFETPITEDISLVASYKEVEMKVGDTYLNKFTPTSGSGKTEATEDQQGIVYNAGWEQALLTNQFNTNVDRWELSANVINPSQGDGDDVMCGFMVYYDADNYFMIYLRWSNCGTIDGLHILSKVNGVNGCHIAKDQWGEDYEAAGTFKDFWSDWSGWSTDSREVIGNGESEDTNWNKYRGSAETTMQYGFGMKLYAEKVTYKGVAGIRYQVGITDEGTDSRTHTWYTPSFVINDKGSEQAPYIGFTNNKVGDVTYTNISFRETPVYTVTFDVDGQTTTQSVVEGYRAVEPEAPTKEGYNFAGWAKGDSAYNFSKKVTSDITLKATWTKDLVAANAVIAKINAIGTVEYTSASKALIDEARAAYDALTELDKEYITADQLKVLTDAEARYAELKAADDQLTADANAVVAKINAIGEVSLESKEAIEEARAAYDALSEGAKARVPSSAVKTLTDAEATYAIYKGLDDAKKAGIAEIEEFINGLDLDKYAAGDKAAITNLVIKAKTEINKATSVQKINSIVSQLKADVGQYKAGVAGKVDSLIDNIFGCEDSVIAISAITSIVSALGIALVAKKRKED